MSCYLWIQVTFYLHSCEGSILWPRCYQRWSLPSTPTNSQGHSQACPWLQNIPHPARCSVRIKMHLVTFLYFPFSFSSAPPVTYRSNLPGCCCCLGILAEFFPISSCLMKWCKAMTSFIQHWLLFFSQQEAHTCDLQLLRIKPTFHFGSRTQGVHARHGNKVYNWGPQPSTRKLNSTSFLGFLLNKLPLNPCTWQWQKAPDHGSSRTNTANSAVISCSLQWREKQIQ